MILLIILMIGILALLSFVFALALMHGSADEQAHYEQCYREYVEAQNKHGIKYK